MLACYLQKIAKRFKKKPNAEWDELRLIIDERADSALNGWLRETATLASNLQNNFDAAANGKPTKYCMKKTVDLEDDYRRRAEAYKKAIDKGFIHDSRLPRLYSSLIVPFINQYAKVD
ncbi:MAG: hypothetical protein CMK50_02385 [Propionibacteriaceae bacterium]|jgi:hypothetical protein|nr:hypothetical protein [Propionibacteriaceae bacterium]MBT67269.1 hypothetical protein [Synechococcus sp. NP17]|tara:strand:+ start:3472 stop:3825 length:354 start_codon:yes stop_codon:yes gene_type:complete